MDKLDPQVVSLAKAIRTVESNNNFTARSKDGSFGAYQFIKPTWEATSKKYGVNAEWEKATPQQQNEVAYKQLKEWKDKGYNVGQIASMWNAGPGKPDAYKEGLKGTNKDGVNYDVAAYAKKVAENYHKYKSETISSTPETPETPQVPEVEPEKRDGFLKSLVKAPLTMLARPVQLGYELLKKGDNTEEIDRFSKEKLGGFVAPIPQNTADLKKDVGRGIQTVAFGMPGLASGGAAFGVGASMEEGNDLFSLQTAFQAALGAGGAKVLGLIGQPLLSATGKVIGKITPQVLKDIVSKGAGAMTKFAAEHNILPAEISRAITTGANKVENIANKPFELTSQVVKKLTTKSEKQIENAIVNKFEKGVKPTLSSNSTPSKVEKYKEDVVTAVKTIKDNKNSLKFTDADGIEITGETPKSLQQMADAIEQIKKKIFSLYDTLAKEAGEAGLKIKTSQIASELDSVINNKALQLTNPKAIQYAKLTQTRYNNVGSLDATVAQDVIQNYNASLQAFYRNPSYDTASQAAIDAMLANKMRIALDEGISGLTGTQYSALKKQYGALKALEKDVVKASLRDARKNVKGLIDFSDILSGSEVVNGLLSFNPFSIAKGTVIKGISTYYKYLNNPNRAIESLFKLSEGLPKLSVPSFIKGATPKITPKVEPKVKPLTSKASTEIGITSFRGTPVKTVGETAPYYMTTRAKGFENTINSTAKDFNVKINNVTRVAGSWEGSIEPSFSVVVKGNMKDKIAYAVTNAEKANQDAVILFTKGKGNGIKYSFTNVKNPDKSLKVLHSNGISGATIYKNDIVVYDMDNTLSKKLRTFTSLTGNKPTKSYGKIQLIEKKDYAKYGGRGGDGNSVRSGQTSLNQLPKLGNSKITKNTSLIGEDARIQDAAILKYEKNPEKLLIEYRKRFGKNYVNADEARKLFKDVGYNGANSNAVHEAASALNKDVWRYNLNVNTEPYAILYSGVSGGGKSTAITKIPRVTKMLDEAAAILDGNLSSYSSALDRITEATKFNKIPCVVHIHRDPIDAFENGIVTRMNNKNSPDYGRVVPIKHVVKTSHGSRETLEELFKTAEDIGMPKEYIIIVDNSLGLGKAKEINLNELLNKKIPDNLESLLVNKVKELYAKGTITKKQLEKFLQ